MRLFVLLAAALTCLCEVRPTALSVAESTTNINFLRKWLFLLQIRHSLFSLHPVPTLHHPSIPPSTPTSPSRRPRTGRHSWYFLLHLELVVFSGRCCSKATSVKPRRRVGGPNAVSGAKKLFMKQSGRADDDEANEDRTSRRRSLSPAAVERLSVVGADNVLKDSGTTVDALTVDWRQYQESHYERYRIAGAGRIRTPSKRSFGIHTQQSHNTPTVRKTHHHYATTKGCACGAMQGVLK